MFSKKYLINVTDADALFDAKLSSIFHFMQNVATEDAETKGIGKANTIEKGMFWVITRYYVEIERMPKYLETVVVKTYPGRDMKFIFPRYFQIESESGEVLVRASSTWVVLNQKTHKIELHPFDHILPEEKIDGQLELPQKVEINNPQLIETRKVRFSELDINSHLNNTNYINYIIDCHNREFYEKKCVKSILINFDHEIKDGDEVNLYREEIPNGELISGRINDVTSFNAKLIFKDR